jgi:serine/threonine-protein kinase HipA
VPPFFSNLLPEGGLRRYLAERAGVNQQREFFLLWVLGLDLPGALSIHPAVGDAPPGADEDLPENAKPNALRFSLAGVQLKFSAFKNAGKGRGLTIPAEGVGGSWIVKLPSQQFTGVPENEFSMMTIAGMIGMEVPVINLVDLDAISGIPEGIGELKGQALAVTASTEPATAPSTPRISHRSSGSSRTTSTSVQVTPTSRASSAPRPEMPAPPSSFVASCSVL